MSLISLKAATLAVAVSAVFAASSEAALISYYNFSNIPAIATAGTPAATGTTTIAATSGSGSISLANFGGNVDDFGGTTLNALNGDAAGASLSLLGGGTGTANPGNGTFADITFSTTGLADPVVTFATQRTATGFTGNTFSFSVDGGTTFTPVTNVIAPPAAFAVVTVDLSSFGAVDNASSVILRYTLVGATSAAGNNRIDNLQINTAPEPAALAVLSLGGFGLLRRRTK